MAVTLKIRNSNVLQRPIKCCIIWPSQYACASLGVNMCMKHDEASTMTSTCKMDYYWERSR